MGNGADVHLHLLSGMSLVGDHTNSARSFNVSGFLSVIGTSSGHTT